MNEINKAYQMLYRSMANNTYKKKRDGQWVRLSLNDLAHLVAMRGIHYSENRKVRLFLVGRAVNGWNRALDVSDDAVFGYSAEEMFQNRVLDWIVFGSTGLQNDSGEYFLSKSPFWSTAGQIARQIDPSLPDDNKEDNWTNYIAWSNLYKVGPKESRNPTSRMCTDQLAACMEILKAEIKAYCPTHILIEAGWNGWAKDFEPVFDASLHVLGENKYRGGSNGIFVEATGKTANGAKLVVACRPEGRNAAAYVEDVVHAFMSLDCEVSDGRR